MVIYAIWNARYGAFLRWGVDGGGKEGYCMFRGRWCFFYTRKSAETVIGKFDHPEDFEVRRFVEMDEEQSLTIRPSI